MVMLELEDPLELEDELELLDEELVLELLDEELVVEEVLEVLDEELVLPVPLYTSISAICGAELALSIIRLSLPALMELKLMEVSAPKLEPEAS